MQKILIICFSNLKKDPRVYRQIINLKDDYEVTAVGLNDPEIDGVKFVQAEKHKYTRKERWLLKLGFYEQVYWKNEITELKEKLLQEKFDLIISNDIDTLPLVIEAAQGAKIIYDAHEYYPEQTNNFVWKFFHQDYYNYLCRKYMKKADAVFSVSKPIINEYRNNFDIEPLLYTNAAEYYDLKPSETGDKIKIIYHGRAAGIRGTDRMIELAKHLDDRFTLDLMVIGDHEYIKMLVNKAKKTSNTKVILPVTREDLVKYTNNYDIGLYLAKEESSFNVKNMLPNKFFEYIQARLMLAIGPTKEMARITKEYDLGIVSEKFDPKELAEKINSLTKEQVMYYKNQSHKAAKELNSENNIKSLKSVAKNLLK